ncbi:hypothetical protein ACRBEV_02750 [Methylobacterium phyllosphaerae]
MRRTGPNRRPEAAGRRTGLTPGRPAVRLACLALALLEPGPAQAQYAAACPPPRKLAAGACVAACPAGYEDRGRDCVYRNTSR